MMLFTSRMHEEALKKDIKMIDRILNKKGVQMESLRKTFNEYLNLLADSEVITEKRQRPSVECTSYMWLWCVSSQEDARRPLERVKNTVIVPRRQEKEERRAPPINSQCHFITDQRWQNIDFVASCSRSVNNDDFKSTYIFTSESSIFSCVMAKRNSTIILC